MAQAGIEPLIFPLQVDALTIRPTRRFPDTERLFFTDVWAYV